MLERLKKFKDESMEKINKGLEAVRESDTMKKVTEATDKARKRITKNEQ